MITSQSIKVLDADIRTEKLLKFKDIKYDTFLDLYNEIKKEFTYTGTLIIRPYVIDAVHNSPRVIPNIYDEVALIEEHLPGVIIDVEKCSVAKYKAWEKRYKKLVRAMSQKNRNNATNKRI